MAVIKLGIRQLVEFTLRAGDIKTTFLSTKRAVDGTKAHSRYQKEKKNQLEDLYEAEVSVVHEYPVDKDVIVLSGRIDGIDRSEGVVVEEIKSTSRLLEDIVAPDPMHMAQVQLYAFIIGEQEALEHVKYSLIYIELENHTHKVFEFEASQKESKAYFESVMNRYMAFYHKVLDFEDLRDVSLEASTFPFVDYRKGQKTLMRHIYESVDQKTVLFARAPTGIGKTIGTLYPALKALAHDKTDKVFYLTAKTIGRKVAADTLDAIRDNGVSIKSVTITAKEKSCINNIFKCNPEECPFARGHYDRINEAIRDIYELRDAFTPEAIEQFAKIHAVCPYEFSLDLSLFSAVVICDYNYAFDPQAMLRRFFVEGTGRYTLLVDEAHNLVDRGREMYSAVFEKSMVLEIRRLIKPLDSRLYKLLGQLNALMLEKRKEIDELPGGRRVEKEPPEAIGYMMRRIQNRIEQIFAIHYKWEHMDQLLEFYFECYGFNRIIEYYSDSYVSYYEKNKSNLKVKMFCLNPAENLQSVISLLQGCVFFSATLTPMPYYRQLLCKDDNSKYLMLGSPFNSQHLRLLVDDKISTKYVDRPSSIEPIIADIHHLLASKDGHYIIYFPSYRYMMDVLEVYTPVVDETLVIQKRGQTEDEKNAFIEAFHTTGEGTKLGFAVMGGMFSEGIDLTGDKLSGVIIVGVGLPQICFERDIIKDYFDNINGRGFEYAYVYPGMNKVMQSGGRVIRTLEDRGVVLLIDQRFRRGDYQKLFPYEWQHRLFLSSIDSLSENIKDFWVK